MNKKLNNHIHIAIPMLDELGNLEQIFKSIESQFYTNFSLYICVNQPEEYWNIDEKIEICERNSQSIIFIQNKINEAKNKIILIDKSSKKLGWEKKKTGVGWARKTLMDRIMLDANPNDIVISLDADTTFESNYFSKINNYFQENININCISIPYYHQLTDNEDIDRAILRYEIYMRYYMLNLLRTKSPYSFTALGSAIAFRVSVLKKIGGFTPKISGEDFYFLQKIIKYKGISIDSFTKVFPASRFSDRVFFGTGPAMIKGNNGNWESYPLYSTKLFDKIAEFYKLIPQLFYENIKTPIDEFIGNEDFRLELWGKLRKNNNDESHFIKSVHDYFDGLKILQFLKQNYKSDEDKEAKNLEAFLEDEFIKTFPNINFKTNKIEYLNEIRDYLCQQEDLERRKTKYISWKISL